MNLSPSNDAINLLFPCLENTPHYIFGNNPRDLEICIDKPCRILYNGAAGFVWAFILCIIKRQGEDEEEAEKVK